MDEVTLKTREQDLSGYDTFLAQIKEHFKMIFSKPNTYLFAKDSTGLFEIFSDALPKEARKEYTCNSCKYFFDKYGGLVLITSEGETKSVIWPDQVPEFFQKAVLNLKNCIEKAKVIGIFLSYEKIWGRQEKHGWHHIAIDKPPKISLGNPYIQSEYQVIAEKKEDFKILTSAISEFPLYSVEQAITLLKTDSLYRSEKCLGVAEWLKKIHEQRNAVKNSTIRDNLTWLAVASAPSGFCHIRSTMIGTLLEDIVSGMDFNQISRRFAEKMNPKQYQRPQLPPSSGNIEQAEKIIEKLKVAKALDRRFARIEDIQAIWKQQPKEPASIEKVGIFSHLKQKNKQPKYSPIVLPTITMTWEKFYRTVLPEAEQIEFKVPSGLLSFGALVTAVNPEAPPILQWDTENSRNTVSWYFYTSGSNAKSWNLKAGTYTVVTAICFQPSMWGKEMPHQGKGIFLLLDGAKDTRNPGSCLFPEMLKSEFHSIRATIEAFSKSKELEGADQATACGFGLSKGETWKDVILKVISKNSVLEYILDRWD